ncbi:hypothetical protein PAPHI01_0224 [Pancytospora philotis]|nr:hypothetical protein PAPHI01_0224 [Pancytospora philotis]
MKQGPMEHQLLLKTLKSYESEDKDLPVASNKNDSDALRVLVNDINRTDFDFSRYRMHSAHARLYKNILYEVLAKFPIKYVQGMAEIATVVVDAYFQEQMGAAKTQGINNTPELSITNSGKATFVYKEASEIEVFNEFLDKNRALVLKAKTALANIYKKKFLVFFDANFKLYKEHNDVFLAMMRKRGIKISREESFKYMNHVLTFFKRAFGNEKVAFTVYRTILTTDPSVLFSLLSLFWDTIKDTIAVDVAKKIEKLPPTYAEDVTKQQAIFLETRDLVRQGGGSRGYVLFGLAASIVAVGVAAAIKYKNKE